MAVKVSIGSGKIFLVMVFLGLLIFGVVMGNFNETYLNGATL